MHPVVSWGLVIETQTLVAGGLGKCYASLQLQNIDDETIRQLDKLRRFT